MKAVFACLVAVALSVPALADDRVVRKVLNTQPLSGAEGLSVIVSQLILKPGGRIPLHRHPGDEHAVIVSGGLALMPDGTEVNFPPMTPVYFPADSVHGGVTNAGADDIVIVTTHILRDGDPFSTAAE